MSDKMTRMNERTFTIPKCDLKQVDGKWSWVMDGSYLLGKEQIIEKLKLIVRCDKLSIMDNSNDSPVGSNPELVCEYNALESFLDLLKN